MFRSEKMRVVHGQNWPNILLSIMSCDTLEHISNFGKNPPGKVNRFN